MFSIYRLYLENIANVTIFLVIGTTENFAQGQTMEGVFVANASAWQNTMSPATQPVNAWPQMKPVLLLMVSNVPKSTKPLPHNSFGRPKSTEVKRIGLCSNLVIKALEKLLGWI